MAKYRKTTPEERAAREQRLADFRAVLEKRLETDRRIAAAEAAKRGEKP
jgi:hypothetical protein